MFDGWFPECVMNRFTRIEQEAFKLLGVIKQLTVERSLLKGLF